MDDSQLVYGCIRPKANALLLYSTFAVKLLKKLFIWIQTMRKIFYFSPGRLMNAVRKKHKYNY